MSHFDGFAEGLATEVMTEMAESFFGDRTRMDNALERVHVLAEELQEIQAHAERYAEILHYVLLGEDGAAAFYTAIGLDAAELPFCLHCTVPPEMDRFPRALTRRGRFEKLVYLAYAEMRQAVDEYLHGRQYVDPHEPRRKRVTTHFSMFKKYVEHVNEQVEKLNSEQTVSGTLQYVRGLDPAEMERANIAGGPVDMNICSLDAEFCFTKVPFESLGLNEFPEMPDSKEVQKAIGTFCSGFYQKNRDEIAPMLNALRKAAKG